MLHRLLLITLALFTSIPRVTVAHIPSENQDPIAQVVQAIMEGEVKDKTDEDYEDVSAHFGKVDLEGLEHHTSNDMLDTYEEELYKEEVNRLFSCYHRENCELYQIDLISEMWGVQEKLVIFVLINPEKQKPEIIRHYVYRKM